MLTSIHDKLFMPWSPQQDVLDSASSLEQRGPLPLPEVNNSADLLAHPDFGQIQQHFLADIDELTQISRFYLGSKHDHAIGVFRNKIEQSAAQGVELLLTYRESREYLHQFVLITKQQRPTTWAADQLGQNLTPLQQTLSLILDDSLQDMDLCLSGVMTRLANGYRKLKRLNNDLASHLYEIRQNLAQAFIADFLRQQPKEQVLIAPGMEVHWGNTFYNLLCEPLRLLPLEHDFLAPRIEQLPQDLIEDCLEQSHYAINDFSVFSQLVEQWSQRLLSSLEVTAHSHWLTQSITLEEITPDAIADIRQNLTEPLNQLLQAKEEDAISLIDIFDSEDLDGERLSLTHFKDKLSAWIAYLLTGSKGQHVTNINNDGSLQLASLQNIYFWVIDKPVKTETGMTDSAYTFNPKKHTKLDVSHLQKLDFLSWPPQQALALCCQAIRQTHHIEPLVMFLQEEAIKEHIMLNPRFLTTLVNECSAKCSQKDPQFKQEFMSLFTQRMLATQGRSLADLSAFELLIQLTSLEEVICNLMEQGADLSLYIKIYGQTLITRLPLDSLRKILNTSQCHALYIAAHQDYNITALEKLLCLGQCDEFIQREPIDRHHQHPEALLQLFASEGKLDGIRYLNERMSAHYCSERLRQYSPLLDAIYFGHAECALALLQIPELPVNEACDAPILFTAIKNGHSQVVKQLLTRADAFIGGDTLDTHPLTLAIQLKSKDILALLLAHPNLNINQPINNIAPIYYAAQHQYWHGVEQLLSQENLSIPSPTQESSLLTLACQANQWGIVERLLTKDDPEINFCDKQGGMNALHYAVSANQLKAVQLLLAQPHIDPMVKTTHGQKSALDLAKTLPEKAILALLKNHSAAKASSTNAQQSPQRRAFSLFNLRKYFS